MNTELAAKVVGLIEAHQANFSMMTWAGGLLNRPDHSISLDNIVTEGASCGTTLCLTGWSSLASGHKMQRLNDYDTVAVNPAGEVVAATDGGEFGGRAVPDFWEYGADLLGISEYHAGSLFVAPEEVALRALKLIADGDESWFSVIGLGA